MDTIRRNYDFYEPMTVHESSLSPCVHSIIAAKLGDKPRSYEFYQRSARLDLDDYNNDTEDGLHITSMAGTWMSVIKGFGSMRVRNGQVYLNPFVPENWKSFAFKIRFRNNILNIITTSDHVTIENLEGGDITINVGSEAYEVKATSSVVVALGATELA